MIQTDKVSNAVALAEFEIECELLIRMDHPNIIQVLGSGKKPRTFLILERLRDLSQVLELNSAEDSRPSMFRKRAFSYVQVLQIAKNLADALRYIHEEISPSAMVIHRDLKPENLGLADDGSLKLFDFGLCRCVRKRNFVEEAYQMTGNTGSLRYMAPEVVLSQPYNETIDAFSFAINIWSIACNKVPFRGFDRTMHRNRVVVNGERPKLERSWPQDFCNLLMRCWHQQPTQRPSFAAISDSLKQMIVAAGGSPGANGPSRGPSLMKSLFGSKR
jgi:serine/threonine protein kinase